MNKQEQIEKYITGLIEQHMLREGDRLFSLREMASMQHTSITPVIAAYEHLEMLGVIESRPKSGYFVAGKAPGPKKELPPYARLFDPEDDEQALKLYRVFGLAANPDLKYPFALRHLPPHLDDSAHRTACLRRSMADYPEDAPDMNSGAAGKAFAHAAIQWTERARWLTNPDHICVTTGVMQALILALEACISRTDTIAIESPGNSYFYFAARLFGARIVPIVSHPETGLDPEAFQAAVEKDPSIRCLLCMPNFSNPTGALMPVPNKQRLLSICEEKDIAIIEYDLFGDYRFGSRRPLPIKAGSEDQVIYISGFRDPVTHLHYISGGKYHHFLRGFADLHQAYVPFVLQDGLADYLMQPQAKKHLRRVRSGLQEAVSAVTDTVKKCFPPGTKITRPDGGFFVWVELPEGCDTLRLLDDALKHGISFMPGSVFSTGADFSNCMRLNCAVIVQRPKLLEGLRILAACLSEEG